MPLFAKKVDCESQVRSSGCVREARQREFRRDFLVVGVVLEDRDSACSGPGAWQVLQVSIPSSKMSLASLLVSAFA
ncbi:MAG: hypothetical protein DMG49_16025 [Acidobacteria bacterium]|nr:MAG: hypothetical protein DMG49_16025 [Acidobacteriota bacterium]